MRFLRTVHTRGTMTLPNDIRNALSISEGDIVEFEVVRVVRKADPSSPSLSQSKSQPQPSNGEA
ncbi:MAG: AbrB/MazE/SpoVT family DNA-binding domain-containing protein [Candidatus Thermoplasmatota archaeon]